MIRLFLTRDSAAVAVGADDVADAIRAEAAKRKTDIHIVRTSSRGMLWLEPFVEVETPQGRVGYGPVSVADVKGLFDAGFLDGKAHPLAQGKTEDIPYLKNQERLTFARAGLTEPVSVEQYVAHGGFAGLKKALAMAGAEVVKEVTESGLRGRGGAGFPCGHQVEDRA
jgi:formate dehydrogenase iron-sulfur subunit